MTSDRITVDMALKGIKTAELAAELAVEAAQNGDKTRAITKAAAEGLKLRVQEMKEQEKEIRRLVSENLKMRALGKGFTHSVYNNSLDLRDQFNDYWSKCNDMNIKPDDAVVRSVYLEVDAFRKDTAKRVENLKTEATELAKTLEKLDKQIANATNYREIVEKVTLQHKLDKTKDLKEKAIDANRRAENTLDMMRHEFPDQLKNMPDFDIHTSKNREVKQQGQGVAVANRGNQSNNRREGVSIA